MRYVNKYNDEKYLEVRFINGKVYCIQTVHGFEVVAGYVRFRFLRQLLNEYIYIPQF